MVTEYSLKQLDMLAEVGLDVLVVEDDIANTHAPLISPDHFKQYWGDKICLLGNIDCMYLLPSGTIEQVEAAVKQAIEDAAEGGGYILCSSNSLHPAVNPENCIAMFEATNKYGEYSAG